MRMISVLAVTLLIPLASTAAPASQQNALDECGANSQAGMRECLGRKAIDSQTLLKRAEGNAIAALGQWDEDAKYVTLAKKKLDTSGKAFEQYREAQCALASSLGGGAVTSALELRRLACVIALNNERAASLASSVTDLPRR
ncbi:hypothetical protein AB595_17875 [Massilia sp. WF1]|uniref:lysozyme inhibitor LprI family protein n=1 Tax=unclassified Massilia TaxID=2609279 RepID=UPI000649B1E9|nr:MULTISPECIES: lysozyme inhibitor LprI family protein [unclassified Massilia]ALK98129.1 hypothetical protein AM586_20010 [Massilia sp. WG5]KLU35601.1 hypothetical protein AB595_17875 [Massilia sp. WF1]